MNSPTKPPTDYSKPPTRVYAVTASMRAVMRVLASGSHTPKLIADRMKLDRGTVHRKLQSLVKRGLVNYDSHGRMYFLTTEGTHNVLENVNSKPPTDSSRGCSTANQTANADRQRNVSLSLKRGENIRVKFPILACPKGWRQSPKVFFQEKRINAKPLGLKNVDGVEYTLDDLRFRMTNSSVSISTRVGEYKDAPGVMNWLIPLMMEQKEKLEREFPELRLENRPIVMWGELAHEGDPVAQMREAKGFHVIRETDGRARVQFDRSKGPIEIEFLHPGFWDGDSETWDRRILQLLDSHYDYDMLGIMAEEAEHRLDGNERDIRGLIQASRLIVQNQGVFDANMKSHLEVLHRLGVAVDRLGVAVSGRRSRRPETQQELGRYV